MNFEGYAVLYTSSLEIPCWTFENRVLKYTWQNIGKGCK